MDISGFFENIQVLYQKIEQKATLQSLKSVTWFHLGSFPDYQNADIVVMGCPHHQGSSISGSEFAPDAIREQFYTLSAPVSTAKIVDLGNLKLQDSEDVYQTIAYVLEQLLRAGKTVVLLGGTHDTAFGQFLAYKNLETQIEYVSIDSRLDLLDADLGLTNRTFHNQIFRFKPNYLKHFVNIGTQIYYVTEAERNAMKSLQFESQRVSEFRTNVKRAEPFFRNANMVSMDLSAARQSDAPGVNEPNPAGFTVDEMCVLARYCGMGYHVNSFSINELNPNNDRDYQTSHLAAVVLWHFVEGFYNRVHDEPKPCRSNLRCFITDINDPIIEDITFYKSDFTDRWWMEVPYPHQGKKISQRLSKLVPCCEEDYMIAVSGEIPERWWLMHCKFLEELV